MNVEPVAAPASMQVWGGEAAGMLHGLSVQGRQVQRSLCGCMFELRTQVSGRMAAPQHHEVVQRVRWQVRHRKTRGRRRAILRTRARGVGWGCGMTPWQ